MKNIPFPQYIIIQTFFPAKETDKCRKINILSLFLSFVFKPAVSRRDILSLCDERSLSIPITEFNHIGTILQICLQLCSTALMFPYKADPGSFTAYFDPAFFRERRAGIPESQQLQLLLYNRLTQTTAYPCCRQICPIDLFMSSGACHLHRFIIVLSGEQIQIPDLRFARHKYLQGSRKE
mgnify:FL=1